MKLKRFCSYSTWISSFLFSDCLLWLAPTESHSWDSDWSWRGSGISQNSAGTPDMIRTRSKSEAEISSLKMMLRVPLQIHLSFRRRSWSHFNVVPPPPPSMVKKHGSNEDKKVELDLEVVVGSALEDERRFEVLVQFCCVCRWEIPVICFFLKKLKLIAISATKEERDVWTSEIRGAKTQLFVSLRD